MKPCTKGKRHKWVFVANHNCRTESLRTIGWTLRGLYKCACGQRKYGEMQRVINTDTKEGRKDE